MYRCYLAATPWIQTPYEQAPSSAAEIGWKSLVRLLYGPHNVVAMQKIEVTLYPGMFFGLMHHWAAFIGVNGAPPLTLYPDYEYHETHRGLEVRLVMIAEAAELAAALTAVIWAVQQQQHNRTKRSFNRVNVLNYCELEQIV